MEAGLRPSELTKGDGEEGVPVTRLLLQGDEETGSRQASDSDMVEVEVIKQVSTGEPAATASKPRRSIDASERTELAVATTAAVELTNLFFLLSGEDAEPRCSSFSCWTEGLAVALAFAVFLSAAGLVLTSQATGQSVAISGDRRRVLVLVSAAVPFVASGAMALSLWSKARGGDGF